MPAPEIERDDMPRALAAELEPDERIVWWGQPATVMASPKLVWRITKGCAGIAFWTLAGLYVPLLAPIVASWGVTNFPIFSSQINAIVPLLFLGARYFFYLLGAISLGVVLYRGLLVRRILARSEYVLTGRRCIVRAPSRDLWEGIEVHSFGPKQLNNMFRTDLPFGFGSLVFRRERLRRQRSNNRNFFDEEFVSTGFLGIKDAKHVQQLVRNTLLDGETSP